MAEEVDDGSVDYPTQYKEAMEDRAKLIGVLRNHLHVLMTNALSAATNTHVTMCRIGEHSAQSFLSDAMHSNLIAAEQARQALRDLTQ